MPPCIWIASARDQCCRHVGAARLGTLLAIRETSVASLVERRSSASRTTERAISSSQNMSTTRCRSAWNVPILTPNCSRCLQVRERALERFVEGAEHLGREADRGAVEHRVEQVRPGVGRRRARGLPSARTRLENVDVCGVAPIHHVVAPDRRCRPRPVASTSEQRESVAGAGLAARSRDDHQLRRPRARRARRASRPSMR